MTILGDPGADIRGEGKSKTPFCLLIGQKNTNVFWHQSEVRTAATKEKASKGKFLGPDKLQNHSNEGNGEEKNKKRDEGKEEKRKKSNVCALSFDNGYFWPKKTVGRKRSIWR